MMRSKHVPLSVRLIYGPAPVYGFFVGIILSILLAALGLPWCWIPAVIGLILWTGVALYVHCGGTP